ncbi:MAG: hypothetical protein NZ920_04860 [Aigarchaeota archaeon]|nr:hypothetical protein [Aigarchaeota archaeon]MDW8093268.1 hypothetical protein [Nitrososphaerota archaeon]
MRSSLYLTPIALIAHTEGGRTLTLTFTGDATEALRRIEDGEPTEELVKFVEQLLNEGVTEISCTSPGLYLSLRALEEPRIRSVSISTDAGRALPRLLLSSGLISDVREYYRRVRSVALALTELRIRSTIGRRDLMIVHAVKTLDDLDKIINMLYGRLVEWYSVHFPELKEKINEPIAYARFVSLIGNRRGMSYEHLSKVLRDESTIREVLPYGTSSLGIDLGEPDEAKIRSIADLILELQSNRDRMHEYISNLMYIEAPNLTAIAGPVLGARLISLAGGLERLARVPASTIQILGAEKALFRFFKTGRGAPKHGVIFQHPYVHSSPRWLRGKIARTLATKISIAARIDFFSREDRSAELRESLERRVTELQEKYREPPQRRPPKQPKTKRVRRR